MVVPWIGFPLHKLLAQVEPTSNAKYVAFETIYAPDEMPGQKDRFIGGGLKYPYVEGLRLDEAMHPLTLLTVGVYGKALPPQNGAPHPCHPAGQTRPGTNVRWSWFLPW